MFSILFAALSMSSQGSIATRNTNEPTEKLIIVILSLFEVVYSSGPE
jgi:hypothetical protein